MSTATTGYQPTGHQPAIRHEEWRAEASAIADGLVVIANGLDTLGAALREVRGGEWQIRTADELCVLVTDVAVIGRRIIKTEDDVDDVMRGAIRRAGDVNVAGVKDYHQRD